VDGYAVRGRPVPVYGGGLTPARLRKVVELVHTKIEDELTVSEIMGTGGLEHSAFHVGVSQINRRQPTPVCGAAPGWSAQFRINFQCFRIKF
jgi:hypothetical protein